MKLSKFLLIFFNIILIDLPTELYKNLEKKEIASS